MRTSPLIYANKCDYKEEKIIKDQNIEQLEQILR